MNGLSLLWKNTPAGGLKNHYSILVKVLDRAGNSLEKKFEISLEFFQISKMHVNNVFTPNNDGYNDTWAIPVTAGTEGVQIRVFDKNGLLLFEADNTQRHWDGTYQGKSLPADTYFWVVTSSRTGETRKGFLTLLR